jgi:hypothetical protein
LGGVPGAGDGGMTAIRGGRSCSHRRPSARLKALRCEQERLGESPIGERGNVELNPYPILY